MLFFTAYTQATLHLGAEEVQHVHKSTQPNLQLICPIKSVTDLRPKTNSDNQFTSSSIYQPITTDPWQRSVSNNDKYAKHSISAHGTEHAHKAKTSEIVLKHKDFRKENSNNQNARLDNNESSCFNINPNVSMFSEIFIPNIRPKNTPETNVKTSPKSDPSQYQNSATQNQKDALPTTSHKLNDEDDLRNYNGKQTKCSEIFSWTPATDDERHFQENFSKVSRNL